MKGYKTPVKDPKLQEHRNLVLTSVKSGNTTASMIIESVFGPPPVPYDSMRVVDRALQYWRKQGKLIFRTAKQAKKDKPAGWSLK